MSCWTPKSCSSFSMRAVNAARSVMSFSVSIQANLLRRLCVWAVGDGGCHRVYLQSGLGGDEGRYNPPRVYTRVYLYVLHTKIKRKIASCTIHCTIVFRSSTGSPGSAHRAARRPSAL